MESTPLSNSQPTPIKPPVTKPGEDTTYIDPNSKMVQDSAKPVSYKPNKKLTIILITIFLLTAVLGVVITNRNAKQYHDSIQPKQLLIPTPTKK